MEVVKDKFNIPGTNDQILFSYKAGVVIDSNKYSTASVSTYGGDVYYFNGHEKVTPISTYVNSKVHHEFWVKLDDGREVAQKISSDDVLLRPGQRIALCGTELRKKGLFYLASIINISTGGGNVITSTDAILTGFDLDRSVFWKPFFLSFSFVLLLFFGVCGFSFLAIDYLEKNRDKINEVNLRSKIPDPESNPYFSNNGDFNSYDDFVNSYKCKMSSDCRKIIISKRIKFSNIQKAEAVYLLMHGPEYDETYDLRSFFSGILYGRKEVDGGFFVPTWARHTSHSPASYASPGWKLVGQDANKISPHPDLYKIFGIIFIILNVLFSLRAVFYNKKIKKEFRECFGVFLKSVYRRESILVKA